ncbi:MAG: hypothetical protein L3J95_06595 [Thermoplasmata archaeon]|nr:hypothetical protein [Thermoplasmata archaeon]
MAETMRPTGPASARNSISVSFVIVASVVAVLGLFSLLLWLITFQWVYFFGVVPMTLGALMFFHTKMGSNRAE